MNKILITCDIKILQKVLNTYEYDDEKVKKIIWSIIEEVEK